LTYEHISPEWVGNRRRVLVSDLSGRSNILYKAKEYNLDVGDEAQTRKILERIKEMEDRGYQYEGAEASFELLVKKTLGTYQPCFGLLGFRVIVEKLRRNRAPLSEATVMVRVHKRTEHQAGIGDGPVDALDKALRKALEQFYPVVKEVKLTDYKVRILSSDRGTKAVTRVLIESRDKDGNKWGTVGVSSNIIEASWQALVDSIEYKLLKAGINNHV
jgi:2-isopropylmalate synthase